MRALWSCSRGGRSPHATERSFVEQRGDVSIVKRIPELRDLSDDHHTGLVLARLCRQTARSGAELSLEPVWEQVLGAFSSHLEPHFQIEEQHLLPGLRIIGEASLARRIREDHDALRVLRGADAVTSSLLEKFGVLLDAHIRFEERQVFEPTQHRLPPGTLEAIASACRTVPRICSVSLET